MKKRAISGVMLTLLLISMLTLAFSIKSVSAVVSPFIAVVPGSTSNPALTPGMNYTVSIYTDYDGADVWGYEFKLTYNPNVLEGIEVVNGDLITGGTADFVSAGFNNTSGELDLTLGYFFFIFPPPPLTSGPGILANVTFSVVGYGSSDISLATDPSDPERTKLFTFYYNSTIDDWVFSAVIDSGTTPNQIQHGFFSNRNDIATAVDIYPDTLNLRSKGHWITAYIELPEGHNIGDIDLSSVMLNGTIPISLLDVPALGPVPTEIGDHDEDGIPDLMVRFNRTMVAEFILSSVITNGYVTLTITGNVDGTPFRGEDTIEVVLGAGGSKRRK